VVRLLLAHGVDPNAVYRNELTALMWAAGYGQTETARALIDAGARVDPVDNRGKNALDMAREFKHAETVQLLEQALRAPRH
jgi:ankyrin repeat protein